MKKPRLTASVLNGILALCNVADAGSCADIFGSDYEDASPDVKRAWDDIQRVSKWVERMYEYRAAKESNK